MCLVKKLHAVIELFYNVQDIEDYVPNFVVSRHCVFHESNMFVNAQTLNNLSSTTNFGCLRLHDKFKFYHDPQNLTCIAVK